MNNLFGKKPSQFADTEPMANLSLASDDDYATAQPAQRPAAAAPAIPELNLSLAPAGAGEFELMAQTRKDGRVCPQPTRWLEFYRVLQEAAQGAVLPAPPLSGSAWASSPVAAKRAAFEAQAAWAIQNGCLVPAYEFLERLSRSDWYYGD